MIALLRRLATTPVSVLFGASVPPTARRMVTPTTWPDCDPLAEAPPAEVPPEVAPAPFEEPFVFGSLSGVVARVQTYERLPLASNPGKKNQNCWHPTGTMVGLRTGGRLTIFSERSADVLVEYRNPAGKRAHGSEAADGSLFRISKAKFAAMKAAAQAN